MIVASLRQLIYLKNEKTHTISYSKYCTDLTYSTTWVNAVIAESHKQAVEMLRDEVRKYLYAEFKENQYTENYHDFRFEMHTTEIEDNRFAICCWDWDGKQHSLEA